MDDEEVHEIINRLSKRLDSLEKKQEETENIGERLDTLERKMETTRKELKQVVETLDTLDSSFETLEKELESFESDHNELEDTVENVREEIYDNREALERKIIEANQRLTEIEHKIGQKDEFEFDERSASRIEHLASLPTYIRRTEIKNKSVDRAVTVFENFDKWSKYTPKGYVITSGELKRFMSESLEWTQIYRVMETFDDKTSTDYSYIETSDGKALIKWHEKEKPD